MTGASSDDEHARLREEDDAYEAALSVMPPHRVAAHRTIGVLGRVGLVIGMMLGGVAGGALAVKLGFYSRPLITGGIIVGSAIPFLFAGALHLNRRRAIRTAAAPPPRLSAGSHAAVPALDGAPPSTTRPVRGTTDPT